MGWTVPCTYDYLWKITFTGKPKELELKLYLIYYGLVDLPEQAFVMKRWQARVWPLNSGASVTINAGGIFLFKLWIVFSDNWFSDDIFLVVKPWLWFPPTASCFK